MCGGSPLQVLPNYRSAQVYTHEVTKMGYCCEVCDRVFDTAIGLNQHRESVQDRNVYPCPKCNQKFKRRQDLQRQARTVHSQKEQHFICGRYLQRKYNIARQMRSQHPEALRDSDEVQPPRKKGAQRQRQSSQHLHHQSLTNRTMAL